MIKIFMFIFMAVYGHTSGWAEYRKAYKRFSQSLDHKLWKLCNHQSFPLSLFILLLVHCQKRDDSKQLINRSRKAKKFPLASRLCFVRKKSSLIITFCFCLIRFHYWITQSDCIDFPSFPVCFSLACSLATFVSNCISKFICANKADKSM